MLNTTNPFLHTEQDKIEIDLVIKQHKFSKFIKSLLQIKVHSGFSTLIFQYYFKASLIIQSIIIYQYLKGKNQSFIYKFIQTIKIYQFIVDSAIGGSYLLKIVIIACIWFSCKGKNQIWADTIKKVTQGFITFINFDLAVTGLLMAIKPLAILPGFLISALMNILGCLVFKNYLLRKEYGYSLSTESMLFFESMLLIQYLTNTISLIYNSILLLCSCFITINSFLLIWYIKFGVTLYFHNCASRILWIYLSFFISINFGCFFDNYFSSNTGLIHLFVLSSLFLLVISFYLYAYRINNFLKNIKSLNFDSNKIKTIDVMLNYFLQRPQERGQFIIRGFLATHEKTGCLNPDCYSLRNNIYDPVCKQVQNVCERERNKETSLRFFLKCVYQQAISKQENINILLDYCEFLLIEMQSAGMASFWLSKAVKLNKGTINLIKIQKCLKYQRQKSETINKIVYGGKLQLSTALQCEQAYQLSLKLILQYCRLHIDIWTLIKSQDVNTTTLKKYIDQAFDLLPIINSKWLFISCYFESHKLWNQVYLSYCLFIKNQKINHKVLQEEQSIQSQSNENYLQELSRLSPITQQSYHYNDSLMFQENVFYLRVHILNNTILIKKASTNIHRFLGYTAEQLKQSPLDRLLTQELRFQHNNIVLNWLKRGMSSNQYAYKIKSGRMITSLDQQIQASVLFKFYVGLDGTAQFVGLIKTDSTHIIQLQNKKLIEKQQRIQRQWHPMKKTLKFLNVGFNNENIQTLNNLNTGSKQLKLNNELNIFLKDQGLQSVKISKQISQIQFSLRLLTFCLLLLVIILLWLSYKDANFILDYTNQYLFFLNLYRFPMALGKNYMKHFLGVGNLTKVADQIKFGTTQFQGFATHPLTIKTLFDPKLNKPAIYCPYKNTTINKGICYDQIDIFYLISSTIAKLQTVPINKSSVDFLQFDSYILPAYDKMLNNTKYRFHEAIGQQLIGVYNNQIYIGITQTIMFTLIVIFITHCCYKYFKKMYNIFEIIIQFDDQDIENIMTFWNKIYKNFKKIQQKSYYNPIQLKRFQNSKLMENSCEQVGVTMNKKRKNIYQSIDQKQKRIKYMIGYTIIMITILLVLLSIQLVNTWQINKIIQFQQDGFYFIAQYPATSILGIALMEKYYSLTIPSQMTFYYWRFQQSVDDLLLIGNYKYIGTPQNSLYFQKQKNYFFGNPCTYNPDVLIPAQSTMNTCLTIMNRIFSNGISTFMRYVHPRIKDYLQDRIKYTSKQMDQISSALTLCAYYFIDAINAWQMQFSDKISSYKITTQFLCISVCIFIILVHIFIYQCLIIRYIKKDFVIMKNVFDKMVPENILIREKALKQRFVIEGILQVYTLNKTYTMIDDQFVQKLFSHSLFRQKLIKTTNKDTSFFRKFSQQTENIVEQISNILFEQCKHTVLKKQESLFQKYEQLTRQIENIKYTLNFNNNHKTQISTAEKDKAHDISIFSQVSMEWENQPIKHHKLCEDYKIKQNSFMGSFIDINGKSYKQQIQQKINTTLINMSDDLQKIQQSLQDKIKNIQNNLNRKTQQIFMTITNLVENVHIIQSRIKDIQKINDKNKNQQKITQQNQPARKKSFLGIKY